LFTSHIPLQLCGISTTALWHLEAFTTLPLHAVIKDIQAHPGATAVSIDQERLA
jgi:hypothetical protein